ncbi:M1 family metallopeptidase [Flavobacterium sp. CYK-4]|uniref:M1 family metallopeptidase n=1 Tax=Flavobacterium lotistagni TaxID=2709660 RepID=UPI001409D338|nr:M1 family metallopeptidase [Flavobacterium lotistagni]NHM07603.1 M1 family metallopeptidase [Flavobacterium lotistagni]
MVALLYSGSPFMANQLPQSKQAQWLSAILDPFGISAFFFQTTHWSIQQRNTELLELNGVLVFNRIGFVVVAILLLLAASKKFVVVSKIKKNQSSHLKRMVSVSTPFCFVNTQQSNQVKWQSFLSFTKIYSTYVVKSMPFALLSLGLLFLVGMEIHAAIEKGIRLPQKYASSGLMVSTIIQSFYVFGALIMVFYSNDLYWRSERSHFNFIEESTTNYRLKNASLQVVLIGMVFFFTSVLILQGICFQFLYNYPKIEFLIYLKTYLYTTLPLILVSIISLIIQRIVKNKYLSLGISGVFILLMTTSLGKIVVKHPLLKFLQTISYDYSDMNGFGFYENLFIYRLAFGFCLTLYILFLMQQTKKSIRKAGFWFTSIGLLSLSLILGNQVVAEYTPKSKSLELLRLVAYEKAYRKYQTVPQPTIKEVIARVDLYPKENRYDIKGQYLLENKTTVSIDEILVNFPDDFTIQSAILIHKNQRSKIANQFQIMKLSKPLKPTEKAVLDFELNYRIKPINSHQSFNAIVGNGAFMRISRYFPQIGYQSSYETDEKEIREKYQLGAATAIKKLNEPKAPNHDFMSLKMTISTDSNQIAVGVGELQKQWKQNNRSFSSFIAHQIPFRFAIASAHYKIEKTIYKGKLLEVYYHANHHENVKYLLENAKLTLDYCQANFGPYPFKTIRFAEVSSFTQGFNATAYPATIYMTENMAFHCNLKADKQPDVINEMAGHELSHLWWGNSQIHPDDRQGAPMLTESLAMYTELMLLKKMYGKEKVKESIAMHQEIYETEKGFLGDAPLIEVTSNQTHIAYSKGAIKMYHLSELIGEDRVNLALKNFINKNKYPNPKPIATDFLKEVYVVADKKYHKQIKELFYQ